jgi:methionine-gamma-lyase
MPKHNDHNLKPETKIIEAGYSPKDALNAVKPPLYLTSTFVFDSSDHGERFFEALHGEGDQQERGLIYSRMDNPNLRIFEERLRVFDGTEAAAGFASGMAAIATTIFALARPDSYLAYASPVYGGTESLFEKVLPKLGIRCLPVRAGDGAPKALIELAEREGTPFMIFAETPANPSIEMTDIAALAEAAAQMESAGVRPLVAVDNTFLGPIFQQPLKHGADLVIYSCTKFIGGHSDFVAGATLGDAGTIRAVKSFRSLIGSTISPFTAWLGTRSLETLDLRMRKSAETAERIASELARHPAVLSVQYPTLFPEGGSQRAIFEKQCSGPGALISFDLPSKKAAFRFLDSLNVFTLAVSLGGNESLAEHPAAHTHSDVPYEVRRKIGIGEGMVRLSIGLEHPDDLLADVLQALDKI